MKKLYFLSAVAVLMLGSSPLKAETHAQDAKAGTKSTAAQAPNGQQYSGMYSFLKDGEFVQVTVEDAGHVSGFISRFGDGESDKGAFLDQFFKNGKIEGNRLSFTTATVHEITFDFTGTVERGEGKNPGDEGYFVIKGTLKENISDENKKMSSHSREVVFKMFPQDSAPESAVRR